MPKVLRYFFPVAASCLISLAAMITPVGGEGTAGSRARAVHTARTHQEASR